MTATNVPKGPPSGFRIDASEQRASTIDLEGELGLAQQAARAHATAHALDRRLAPRLLCLRRPARFLDSASGDLEGVSDAI